MTDILTKEKAVHHGDTEINEKSKWYCIHQKKHLNHRATEQLSKNKEEFGLKPEKTIHLFAYGCRGYRSVARSCNCLISQLLSCSVVKIITD